MKDRTSRRPAPFDPIALLEALHSHGVDHVVIGGLAGVLHGSPATTNDADIVPDPEPDNLERLAALLRDVDARLRVTDDPDGVAFDPHPALLASIAMLNTTTRHGDLDIGFRPAGIEDYATLRQRAVAFDVDGIEVWVACLDDVIRSKQTADRPKDRATLPLLRALRDELDRR